MHLNKSIGGASLILSWALLLSARCVAASLYGTQPGVSYNDGLQRIGNFLPLCAWICFSAGVVLVIVGLVSDSTPKAGQ
jgi:hypothetical protein